MIGSRIGNYEIVARLGEGGMGAVYRARDTDLNREVAIKVLLPVVANDPERLARFSREAQLLASLNHQNIGSIYGLVDANGSKALVLELIEGPTLADRIAKGPLALDEALPIARQLADALDAAHGQGIVHRDLKPANIKLRPDGTVKVLDFGLAKAVDSPPTGTIDATTSPTMSVHATTGGMILGTAAYMSPEQASGRPLDKRTDIWSFGVVLWEMLTGRRLFEGETISHVLAAVLREEPDLASVPLQVRPLLARCLQRDALKRLRDIGDAMSLVVDSPVTAQSPAPARRWFALAGWPAAALLAAALAVAIGTRPESGPEAPVSAPMVGFSLERTNVDPVMAASFALSPDGRFLAHYVNGTNGQIVLSVRTLATGESREVPGSATIGPRTPFWSFDSRRVAYITTEASYVFELATGTARELCVCRFDGGSWNADGVILLGGGRVGEPIRRLSLDERTPVAVTHVTAANGEQDTRPVFLAGGPRFLFTRLSTESAPVTYLGSLDGGEPTRVADGSRLFVATAPSGTGQWLLGIESAGLVAQAFDPLSMKVTGDSTVIVPGAAAVSVSRTGVLVTSASGSRTNMLPTWFDRKGTVLGTVGEPGPFYGLNLSPDDRAIVIHEPNGTGFSLRDVSGASRRLTFNRDASPAWSPDGKRLIMSSRRDGVVNLYERAVDGSGPETRLFPADRDSHANDWSRDGRWVIYTIAKDVANILDLDLWVFPLRGEADRKPMPYLTSAAREAQAEFSPDGRFVAYTASENGKSEVYVQPFPNATDGKWLISRGGGVEPHWSRDGTELFYFSGQSLMAVQVHTQPVFAHESPTRLFDAPVQPWFVNDSDRTQVSSDGQRFLILAQKDNAAAPPIDVAVNWTSLLDK